MPVKSLHRSRFHFLFCSDEDGGRGANNGGDWNAEDKNLKPKEALFSRGTKGTKRAYDLALKAFQDLAREVGGGRYCRFYLFVTLSCL